MIRRIQRIVEICSCGRRRTVAAVVDIVVVVVVAVIVMVVVVVVVCCPGGAVFVVVNDAARQMSQRSDLIAQDPRDGTYRRHVVLVAHAVGQQTVADLPREDARVFALELFDVADHLERNSIPN